jgi:5-methylcytosine-specific restriction protein A
MPWKPPKPCAHPGCGALTHARFCDEHERAHHAGHDARRRAEQPWRRWYKTTRWKTLRLARLQADPLCAFCKRDGRVTAATVVDHVHPHRGDERRFFDFGNTQSLCKPCHDREKQAAERRAAEGEGGANPSSRTA